MVIGLLIGGFVILHNAQEAVEAEISSSFELAKKLIRNNSASDQITHKSNVALSKSIKDMRHVQVIVEPQPLIKSDGQSLSINGVPRWFIRLVYPKNSINAKLVTHERMANNISIAADPADEIKEVWKDVKDLLVLTLSLFIASLVLIYFSIWHGLKPLKILQEGFEKLEKDHLDITITEDTVPELEQLHKSFNHMVSVLRKTTLDKQKLSRKLVTLQEDERNHISRELHDEIGPYLFSLRVSNSNLKKLNDENNQKEISISLASVDKTLQQLQLRIKQLLKLLRPMILNDLSLEEALNDQFSVFKTTKPDINWQLDYNIEIELNDTLNVTIYRIVQECLTNIGRHSNAKNALVSLSIKRDSENFSSSKKNIEIIIKDDGKGILSKNHSGLGLRGMQERTQALGGNFILNSIPHTNQTGVCISIEIPITELSKD